ncbi:UDP-N-acetylmuramoyl-L-alanine--D-glutamate ligase [Marininema halotolerans]|nr:UDP-N-acetylmuramoyl-L-alanine--D-glutamate ligase [Marininema halotolerans]
MEEWKGQTIVVLGLARSGVAVARLLFHLGAKVTVNDRKPRAESPEAEELENLGIPVICGEHPENLIHEGVDLLVKNPGIPYSASPVQQALVYGIPVVTEVEIAYRVASSPIIGITGSNGKTTTTTLVGRMLKKGKVPSVVAGNIGRALAEVAPELKANEWLVAELSSFQLKGVQTFRPRIGALLNIVPAHMDYHGDLNDYTASKEKLFSNQQPSDIAVLNWDSPECRSVAKKIKAQILWFSRHEPVDQGIYFAEGRVMVKMANDAEAWELMPVSDIHMPGVHQENGLAAAAIALAAGCPKEAIRQELATFTGVEHRLEFVGVKRGARWYNDSKATNAKATIAAIESFHEPVVLIAGGLDRGVDFRECIPAFRKLKGIVAYGEAADVLLARAKDAGIPEQEQYHARRVEEAVFAAANLVQSGDVALLSPACASWDQHTSFEERGSIFKQAVHIL